MDPSPNPSPNPNPNPNPNTNTSPNPSPNPNAAGGSLMDPSHTDDGSALTLSVLIAAPGGEHGAMAGYGEMASSGEIATLSPDEPGVMITHPMAVRR